MREETRNIFNSLLGPGRASSFPAVPASPISDNDIAEFYAGKTVLMIECIVSFKDEFAKTHQTYEAVFFDSRWTMLPNNQVSQWGLVEYSVD